MFGPFKGTIPAMGGLLWKRSWRMSQDQKFRLRKRMQMVDRNIEVLHRSLAPSGGRTGHPAIDQLKFDFPKESEMAPADKYTTFNKNAKDYRKAVHHVPKWTRMSFRRNPEHF